MKKVLIAIMVTLMLAALAGTALASNMGFKLNYS